MKSSDFFYFDLIVANSGDRSRLVVHRWWTSF